MTANHVLSAVTRLAVSMLYCPHALDLTVQYWGRELWKVVSGEEIVEASGGLGLWKEEHVDG